MLHYSIFAVILSTYLWSSETRASGSEENELLKYLENLRRSTGTSELQPSMRQSAGIGKIISLIDQDEPNLPALSEEIAVLENAIKPNARTYLLSRYAIAVAYQRTEQYAKAATLAARMLKEKVSRDWQYAFYEIFFLAAWELDNFEAVTKAFPRYSKLFGIARKNEKIAVVAYQSFMKMGDDGKAVEILEELVRGYPGSEHSRFAFKQLVERTCTEDPSKRYVFSNRMLVQLSRNNDLNNGIKEFVLANIDHKMVMEDGAVRLLTDFEKTEYLFKTRMYDEALALLREQYELKRNDPQSTDLPELMYGLARTLMRVQDYKRSAMFASKFLSQYDVHSLRTNMKEILADSLRYLNVPNTASTLYKELSAGSNVDHFRWQTFWTLYIGRQYEEALKVMKSPETRSSGGRISDDGMLYWEANLLGKLGRKKESAGKYAELMNRHPNGFYASYMQVDHQTKTKVEPHLTVQTESPAQNGEKGVLLANFGKKPASGETLLGPNRLAEVITFAEDLTDSGREDLARLYLSEVDSRKVNDWPTYKGLADISFKLGIFKPTKTIRYQKFSPLRDIPDDWDGYQSHIRDHENHWKVYFPNAYGNVVGPVAEVFNRSKFLILSIMRAESFYNHEARSPVGAIGLMQMMPYTAIKIANLVKDFDFQMSELTKPEFSIGYGAYYIDKLQRYYQENPILAVAAYNAGPKAVNQWIESCRDCSMDEFVESIPYKETRNYVKKVISYFFNYFRVYNAGVPDIQNLSLPEYIPDSNEIF